VILLETSALIENLRASGRKDIKARVQAAILSTDAALCEPVLLELWAGAIGKKDAKVISAFEDALPTLECDTEVWQLAKKHAREFRAMGLTFSNVDILIFSIAVRHNAHIVAVDKAFAQMREALSL